MNQALALVTQCVQLTKHRWYDCRLYGEGFRAAREEGGRGGGVHHQKSSNIRKVRIASSKMS